jgi:hypothetical protein
MAPRNVDDQAVLEPIRFGCAIRDTLVGAERREWRIANGPGTIAATPTRRYPRIALDLSATACTLQPWHDLETASARAEGR